jgi:plastocyanin
MRGYLLWIGSAALASALTLAACGGGGDSTPTAPTPTPSPTPTPTPTPTPGGTTITITASGVSPQSLTVAPGTRVTFVNNDTRNHEMNSDPHPSHGDCPELDQVAFLTPGQSKQTGNLNTIRTCGYHDHNQPSTTSLQGTIVIRQ